MCGVMVAFFGVSNESHRKQSKKPTWTCTPCLWSYNSPLLTSLQLYVILISYQYLTYNHYQRLIQMSVTFGTRPTHPLEAAPRREVTDAHTCQSLRASQSRHPGGMYRGPPRHQVLVREFLRLRVTCPPPPAAKSRMLSSVFRRYVKTSTLKLHVNSHEY